MPVNMSCGKQVIIQLGSAAPTLASAFYTPALPHAGYEITGDTLSSNPQYQGLPQDMAEISFTGHGYTRVISAFANLGPEPSAGIPISLPSSFTRNNVQIVLTPADVALTSACPR